jgi:hypothetical protein
MKPGTRLILSCLHGFLLDYPQLKNLTCSQPVSSVQDSSAIVSIAMPRSQVNHTENLSLPPLSFFPPPAPKEKDKDKDKRE